MKDEGVPVSRVSRKTCMWRLEVEMGCRRACMRKFENGLPMEIGSASMCGEWSTWQG